MEETFSSLVCFQPPRSGPSLPFAVPKTQMSRAGLQNSAVPSLGGWGSRQSCWVLSGNAKTKTNFGASCACAQKHGGVHTPKMLWVHLYMQLALVYWHPVPWLFQGRQGG